jgi:hypothetical protein
MCSWEGQLDGGTYLRRVPACWSAGVPACWGCTHSKVRPTSGSRLRWREAKLEQDTRIRTVTSSRAK